MGRGAPSYLSASWRLAAGGGRVGLERRDGRRAGAGRGSPERPRAELGGAQARPPAPARLPAASRGPSFPSLPPRKLRPHPRTLHTRPVRAAHTSILPPQLDTHACHSDAHKVPPPRVPRDPVPQSPEAHHSRPRRSNPRRAREAHPCATAPSRTAWSAGRRVPREPAPAADSPEVSLCLPAPLSWLTTAFP